RQDADRSLLVIDTGGWFRIGCPTSQIARPEIKGAIYRIRKKGATALTDPRGLEIRWDKFWAYPSDISPYRLLRDARFAVRDRAIAELAKRGKSEAETLRSMLFSGIVAPEDQKQPEKQRWHRNILWALTRMDVPEACAAVRH